MVDDDWNPKSKLQAAGSLQDEKLVQIRALGCSVKRQMRLTREVDHVKDEDVRESQCLSSKDVYGGAHFKVSVLLLGSRKLGPPRIIPVKLRFWTRGHVSVSSALCRC